MKTDRNWSRPAILALFTALLCGLVVGTAPSMAADNDVGDVKPDDGWFRALMVLLDRDHDKITRNEVFREVSLRTGETQEIELPVRGGRSVALETTSDRGVRRIECLELVIVDQKGKRQPVDLGDEATLKRLTTQADGVKVSARRKSLMLQPNSQLQLRLNGKPRSLIAKFKVDPNGKESGTAKFVVRQYTAKAAETRGQRELGRLMQQVQTEFPDVDPDEMAELSHVLQTLYLASPRRKETTLGQRAAAALRSRGEMRTRLQSVDRPTGLAPFYPQFQRYCELLRLSRQLRYYDYDALERSVQHLQQAHGEDYPRGEAHLAELGKIRQQAPDPSQVDAFHQPELARQMVLLRRRALVDDNPTFDFDEILVVKRKSPGPGRPLNVGSDRPPNWAPLTSLGPGRKHESVIAAIPIRSDTAAAERVVYAADRWVGKVDLHFDGERLLFSAPDLLDQETNQRRSSWNLYEMSVDDGTPHCLTPSMPDDVDSYDACYLADDRVIFGNTSGYQGVPCVSGNDWVANLHVIDPQSGKVRRLTFEQDSDWHPTLLPNGRVLYLRWEYTDSAHYYSRVLMHMNPDGTDQREYYGSNSYWPNSLFYAKPLPGSSTKFVGIVSGHHGVKRCGELTLFDVSLGRTETQGAVQRIPGYGLPVENITRDRLVDQWPYKMVEPFPLDDDYFLAALAEGGIVLVDRFDNIVPLKTSALYSYYEPIPLRAQPRPPVIPDRIRPSESTAIAHLSDIYLGRGLPGVPRGLVKALRVYRYEFAPRNRGGHYDVGMEAGWDVKVLLGEVPVNSDGSAMFRIPANSALALQPLDEEGAALTHMRSWFTAMPGEVISCIGCHENQNDAPPTRRTIASGMAPQELQDVLGPPRGFSFMREVQPVLDKYCIGCHDGTEPGVPDFADISRAGTNMGGAASKSYWALHPYVRRNGPEGNYRSLTPLEFHIDTSELVQVLKKGHHGVALSDEAWKSLITWIDLNVPYRGMWDDQQMERRFELRKQFVGDSFVFDYETDLGQYQYERTEEFVQPESPVAFEKLEVAGFPRKVRTGEAESVELGEGVTLQLMPIPAGQFAMGSTDETPAEGPLTAVTIDRPFLMGRTEVTLQQYRQFDPTHQNYIYDMHYKDQVRPGYDMDVDPEFPVIRVSWEQAIAFCAWMSEKIGRKVTLPTEAQWEWAARAGTDSPLYFGGGDDDFGAYANLADVSLKKLAVRGVDPQPIANPDPFWDFVPNVAHVDDGVLHLAQVGSYQPNGLGLQDMIGNVCEWTRSAYQPYPYDAQDGRNDTGVQGIRRVVRGGSWYDRPRRATSSWRWGYPQWQRVFNTGFRVVVLP